jgi:hypothetical protein
MPEQPLLRTPMRMPAVGLPRPSISAFTRSAAAGVTLITCGRGRRTRGAGAGAAGVAGWEVSVVVLIRSCSAIYLLGYSAACWASSFLAVLAR